MGGDTRGEIGARVGAGARVYAIVDLPHRGGLDAEAATRAILAGGAFGLCALQLRAKGWPHGPRALGELARALASICAAASVPFVLNDALVLAHALKPELGAALWGVHLGQEDLRAAGGLRAVAEGLHAAGMGLGHSTHDLDQLQRAQLPAAGSLGAADYLALGPIFSTPTKRGHEAVVTVPTLARARADRPLLAIGGLDAERGRACLDAGADAVAVAGALVASTRAGVEGATRTLVEALAEPGSSHRM